MEVMDLDGGPDVNANSDSDDHAESDSDDHAESDSDDHANSNLDVHADAGAAGGPSVVGSMEGEDDAMGSDSS